MLAALLSGQLLYAQAPAFKQVSPKDIPVNAIKLFQNDWFLLTGGDKAKFNPMTISWGTLGCVWSKPVVTIYVRADRFTYTLMEQGDYFTLCAFPPESKSILEYCGSRSGKDTDKVKATGLKPLYTENGSVYYEQASLVLECKKIYSERIRKEGFTDPLQFDKIYSNGKPTHKMYVGEIVKCLVKGE